jgi:tRNA-Thr(GGU) m(6)t(6)A37 methyltransferase TsaA
VDNTLRPIGAVRSEIKDRKSMPPFGAPASVEIFPEFADALLKIEKHTHFWVLAWLMARPERDVLQVTPRGVDPNSADPLHGVFAVRSPARPNPIGLTAARLTGRDGLILHFDLLDFLDGTPVIDVKPYFISRDLIFSAGSAPIGRPRDRDALRESLRFQVRRFHPVDHPDVELAIGILERFRMEQMEGNEPRQWQIQAPLDRPHVVNALIGMTRVRLGAGLELSTDPAVSINGYRYPLP